jgi:hypothetical protein
MVVVFRQPCNPPMNAPVPTTFPELNHKLYNPQMIKKTSIKRTYQLLTWLLPLGLLAAPAAAQPLVVPDGKAYQGRKIIAKVTLQLALGHDSYNTSAPGVTAKLLRPELGGY